MEETKKEKEEKHGRIQLILIVLGIIFLIATVIGMYYVSKENPDIALSKIFIWGGIFIFLSLGLIFGTWIFTKVTKKITKKIEETPLPEAMATDELLNIVKHKSLKNKNFMNEVKSVLDYKFSTIGDKGNMNKVFVALVEPLFPINNRDKVFVIINAHYVSKYMSVLFNPKPSELISTIQAVGGDPIEKVDSVSERKVITLDGNEVYTKETKMNKKDAEEETKQKEGDIQ